MARHILKSLEIEEVSVVEKSANPHAKVTILKSAEPVRVAKTFDEAYAEITKSRVNISKAGEESLMKMLAAIKSETIEKSKESEMNNLDPNAPYEKLIAETMEKRDLSRTAAHSHLQNERTDLLEKAYAEGEAIRIARLSAEAEASGYGH